MQRKTDKGKQTLVSKQAIADTSKHGSEMETALDPLTQYNTAGSQLAKSMNCSFACR